METPLKKVLEEPETSLDEIMTSPTIPSTQAEQLDPTPAKQLFATPAKVFQGQDYKP